MTSVGYGDYSAQNDLEYGLGIITMLISTGIFAYSVSLIGSIISEIRQQTYLRNQRMYFISHYMQQKKVDTDLQNNIREYISYVDENSSFHTKDEENVIIQQLPIPLKSQLKKQVYKNILKIFTPYFSKSLQEKMIEIISERSYRPHEIMYDPELQENEPFPTVPLFVVNSGKAKLLPKNDNGYHHRLIPGNIYGLVEFFNGKIINSKLQSMEFTKVFILKREEFINLLQQYPKDYEKFCQIKDEINLNNSMKSLPLRCYICKQNHQLKSCNIVHLDRSQLYFKVKQTYRQDENKSYQRNRTPMAHNFRDLIKTNSLITLPLIQYDQQQFTNDYFELIEQVRQNKINYINISPYNSDSNIIVQENYQNQYLLPNDNQENQKKQNKSILKKSISNYINNIKPHIIENYNNKQQNSNKSQKQKQDRKKVNLQLQKKMSQVNIENKEYQKLTLIKNNSIQQQQENFINNIDEFPNQQFSNLQYFQQNSNQVNNKNQIYSIRNNSIKYNRQNQNTLQQMPQNNSNSYAFDLNKNNQPQMPILRKRQSTFKNSIDIQLDNQALIYSKILDKHILVGNQISDNYQFIQCQDLDQVKNWNNYFPKFNFNNVVLSHNIKVQSLIIQLIMKQRRKSQIHYKNLKLKQPSRSFSQPHNLNPSSLKGHHKSHFDLKFFENFNNNFLKPQQQNKNLASSLDQIQDTINNSDDNINQKQKNQSHKLIQSNNYTQEIQDQQDEHI